VRYLISKLCSLDLRLDGFADRDDAHDIAVVDDGQMPNPPVHRQRHALVDRGLLFDIGERPADVAKKARVAWADLSGSGC
jgi:hypothetical protein